MNTSQPDPQSTSERRAANGIVRSLIERHAPTRLTLVDALRKSLRKRLPTAHEIVYEYRSWFVISFSPSEHGHEGVLGIRGDAAGVRLYFSRGKGLPDPEKLLKGSAQVRFIEVSSASTLTRPAVASLIDETIARNPVAFVRDGDGSVILKSASAKASRPARKKVTPAKASGKGRTARPKAGSRTKSG